MRRRSVRKRNDNFCRIIANFGASNTETPLGMCQCESLCRGNTAIRVFKKLLAS